MVVDEGRKIFPIGIILIVVTLERLAYYTLATNFYFFLNEGPWNSCDGWNTLDSLTAVLFLAGVSYTSSLIGGYVSDVGLGRFKTIVLGFVLYSSGFIFLVAISGDVIHLNVCDAEHPGGNGEFWSKIVIYSIISVLGFGVGFVRSNIAPFGAQQVQSSNVYATRHFFNWFYWCINLGSLTGVGVLGYIIQDNPGFCRNGFLCGFAGATACLIVGISLFVASRSCFEISTPDGSMLGKIFSILWEATALKVRTWFERSNEPNRRLYRPAFEVPRFFDRAKVRFGGSHLEGTVHDVRTLCIISGVFLALVPHWIVYFQMGTSFQAQALHMRLALCSSTNGTSPDSFKIPSSWLTLFDQLFVILAIPVFTMWMYPKLDRTGLRMSLLFRMGLGMLFSLLAIITAGLLESRRLYLYHHYSSSHIDQTIGNVTYKAVDMSVFLQVPQYILVGAAEVFTSIAGLEYAYSTSPNSFQGLIMGLFYTLEGVGSLLGTTLLQFCSPLFLGNKIDYTNINENHLDYYFYLLATIQAFCILVYWLVCRICTYSARLLGLSETTSPEESLRQRLPSEYVTHVDFYPTASIEYQYLLYNNCLAPDLDINASEEDIPHMKYKVTDEDGHVVPQEELDAILRESARDREANLRGILKNNYAGTYGENAAADERQRGVQCLSDEKNPGEYLSPILEESSNGEHECGLQGHPSSSGVGSLRKQVHISPQYLRSSGRAPFKREKCKILSRNSEEVEGFIDAFLKDTGKQKRVSFMLPLPGGFSVKRQRYLNGYYKNKCYEKPHDSDDSDADEFIDCVDADHETSENERSLYESSQSDFHYSSIIPSKLSSCDEARCFGHKGSEGCTQNCCDDANGKRCNEGHFFLRGPR